MIPIQGPSKSSGDKSLRSMRLLLRECPGVETGLPSHEADGVRNGDLAGLKKFREKLTHKAANTTISEFANTVDPDERAHNEPPHLDLQCLPSSL